MQCHPTLPLVVSASSDHSFKARGRASWREHCCHTSLCGVCWRTSGVGGAGGCGRHSGCRGTRRVELPIRRVLQRAAGPSCAPSGLLIVCCSAVRAQCDLGRCRVLRWRGVGCAPPVARRHRALLTVACRVNRPVACRAVQITAAAFSGDGSIVAVVYSHIITLWNPLSNVLRRTLLSSPLSKPVL